MIADSSFTGVTWTSVIAAAVFLLALVALAVDRVRLQRRLAVLERSGALLETDLADARREIADLRGCLRGRPDATSDLASGPGATAGDPGAPFG